MDERHAGLVSKARVVVCYAASDVCAAGRTHRLLLLRADHVRSVADTREENSNARPAREAFVAVGLAVGSAGRLVLKTADLGAGTFALVDGIGICLCTQAFVFIGPAVRSAHCLIYLRAS
jgi:hypothetical protein